VGKDISDGVHCCRVRTRKSLRNWIELSFSKKNSGVDHHIM
jgi:hypothetical protein